MKNRNFDLKIIKYAKFGIDYGINSTFFISKNTWFDSPKTLFVLKNVHTIRFYSSGGLTFQPGCICLIMWWLRGRIAWIQSLQIRDFPYENFRVSGHPSTQTHTHEPRALVPKPFPQCVYSYSRYYFIRVAQLVCVTCLTFFLGSIPIWSVSSPQVYRSGPIILRVSVPYLLR